MVSDLHVSLARAMLLGDEEECAVLMRRHERDGARTRRNLDIFLSSVFTQAARRRFGAHPTRPDVIRYVADARTREPLRGVKVDITLAERLLIAHLESDWTPLEGADPVEANTMMAPLLVDLMPNPPDEQVIDEVLASARDEADELIRRLAG